jgi:hypothetical protein
MLGINSNAGGSVSAISTSRTTNQADGEKFSLVGWKAKREPGADRGASKNISHLDRADSKPWIVIRPVTSGLKIEKDLGEAGCILAEGTVPRDAAQDSARMAMIETAVDVPKGLPGCPRPDEFPRTEFSDGMKQRVIGC